MQLVGHVTRIVGIELMRTVVELNEASDLIHTLFMLRLA
jgi:hypothetical protein